MFNTWLFAMGFLIGFFLVTEVGYWAVALFVLLALPIAITYDMRNRRE